MDFQLLFCVQIIEIPNVVILALIFEMNGTYLRPRISTSIRNPSNDFSHP
jgi:hypothetical protein